MASESFDTNPLTPDMVITLEDATQLASFEELVCEYILPDMQPSDRQIWLGRTALKELLRPPKFNGRLQDIELTVMDNPLLMLQTIKERGLHAQRGGTHGGHRTSELGVKAMELAQGFYFRADAKSTGKPVTQEVTAELYYYPLPRTGSSTEFYDVRQVNNNGGSPMIRTTTKPVLDARQFEDMHDESVRIGLEVLRADLRRVEYGRYTKKFHIES